MYVLYSQDKLSEVDDPYNHLASMKTEEVYDNTGVPPHKMKLKVDDMCLIMRTLSKKMK